MYNLTISTVERRHIHSTIFGYRSYEEALLAWDILTGRIQRQSERHLCVLKMDETLLMQMILPERNAHAAPTDSPAESIEEGLQEQPRARSRFQRLTPPRAENRAYNNTSHTSSLLLRAISNAYELRRRNVPQ